MSERRRKERAALSNLGPQPFLTYGMRYLAKREPFFAPLTVKEMDRKIRCISRLLSRLRREGVIKSQNPRALDRDDIAALVKWYLDEEYERSYIAKMLGIVKAVAAYAGNPVFDRMKAEGEEFPTRARKDLREMSDEELQEILAKAAKLRGWEGEVKRLFVNMYPATGLRPSELRLAHVSDIDTRRWTIFVRHPKGERRYAEKRTAPIIPLARPAVLAYLRAREAYLKKHGVSSEFLICSRKGTPYSDSKLREFKAHIQKEVDFAFHLKSFRDKYAQDAIDRAPHMLSQISKTLGHATTRTTEQSYGRVKTDRAVRDIQSLYENTLDREEKKGHINNCYDNTGYA